MVWHTAFGGDVEQARHPPGSVGGKAKEGARSSDKSELQNVVNEHQRLAKIDDEIMQSLANGARGTGAIDLSGRKKQPSVEFKFNLVTASIEPLVRVDARRCWGIERNDSDGKGGRGGG